MRTWEMIKELTENPKKKFVVICDELEEKTIVSIKNNELIILEGYQKLFTHDEWEEVKQPVSFMEAFKALRSYCKNIYCMNGKSRIDFTEDCIGAHVFDEDLIAEGKWYIED